MIRKRKTVRANADRANKGVPREGALLFEVLIAMFVLLISMVSMGQYFSNALRSSTQGMLRAKASIFCESKLNELLATNHPLESRGTGSFAQETAWSWEYYVTVRSPGDLQQLTVTVQHQQHDSAPIWSLSRLFRPLDPPVAD